MRKTEDEKIFTISIKEKGEDKFTRINKAKGQKFIDEDNKKSFIKKVRAVVEKEESSEESEEEETQSKKKKVSKMKISRKTHSSDDESDDDLKPAFLRN